MALCCSVIELRQYTLHPGAPDRFVWVRGFSDMEARARALAAFYGGPVWKEHGPAANATMVDHTNVLLLRPVDAQAGFRFDPSLRLVTFFSYPNAEAYGPAEIASTAVVRVERLRLQPTRRSFLRHSPLAPGERAG